uniref:(northern house mosquito) hypothetical protein n=1 Tax=Culex pipiens TaxID=7175 RepID=A0A8D8L8P5_CULPI
MDIRVIVKRNPLIVSELLLTIPEPYRIRLPVDLSQPTTRSLLANASTQSIQHVTVARNVCSWRQAHIPGHRGRSTCKRKETKKLGKEKTPAAAKWDSQNYTTFQLLT